MQPILGRCCCRFTGTLPEYWGSRLSFVSLQTLNLQDNSLSGALPRWNQRGAWPMLTLLNLQGNNFYGEGSCTGTATYTVAVLCTESEGWLVPTASWSTCLKPGFCATTPPVNVCRTLCQQGLCYCSHAPCAAGIAGMHNPSGSHTGSQ